MSADPIADAALEACFAALAITVTYQSRFGQAVEVQAVHVTPPLALDALGGGRVALDGFIGQIRAADLPRAPGDGDLLIVDGRRYRVRSARWADTARKVWEVEAVPC